jgi:hypothetical protein
MLLPSFNFSYIHTDTTALQQAIKNNASKKSISYLKQQIAHQAVTGFKYSNTTFDGLALLLAEDYGFSPYKFKTAEEGAIFDKKKHINPIGGIRGKHNITNPITWICLDIDSSPYDINETHAILAHINHHVALTSNPVKLYKYRIILPLTTAVIIPSEEWKFFIRTLTTSLGIQADILGPSQCYYGYKGREVLTINDKFSVDPLPFKQSAHMMYVAIEERKNALLQSTTPSKALAQPYTTFSFAYDAQDGEGNTMLLGAISKAKDLGATREYIKDLIININNFWDDPMPLSRLESTILTAI